MPEASSCLLFLLCWVNIFECEVVMSKEGGNSWPRTKSKEMTKETRLDFYFVFPCAKTRTFNLKSSGTAY